MGKTKLYISAYAKIVLGQWSIYKAFHFHTLDVLRNLLRADRRGHFDALNSIDAART